MDRKTLKQSMYADAMLFGAVICFLAFFSSSTEFILVGAFIAFVGFILLFFSYLK